MQNQWPYEGLAHGHADSEHRNWPGPARGVQRFPSVPEAVTVAQTLAPGPAAKAGSIRLCKGHDVLSRRYCCHWHSQACYTDSVLVRKADSAA